MKGYMGKILRVDLTSHSATVESLGESLVQRYIGGTGLASRVFCSEVDPNVDALSAENKLVFAVGPLAATAVPLSGRHEVVAKSPLTGLWGEGDAGGFWGVEFKRAGFDALVIEGSSPSPVYLWICNGEAQVRPAPELWGMDTYTTAEALKCMLGRKARIAAIGQAGERLVKFATIMNDGGRAVGRCGLGAVMGAKNLKAIAVSGDYPIDVAAPDALRTLRQEMVGLVHSSRGAQMLAKYGTGFGLDRSLTRGNLPLKNWAGDQWELESALAISADKVEGVVRTKAGCYGCPLGCEKVLAAGARAHTAGESKGPEYETIAALGSLLLNDDWPSIVEANNICNCYGMDTIETGTTIAMVMECLEKGILSEQDLGLPLHWGNSDAIVHAVRMIGEREGLGDVLAEGVRGAAREIGGEAPRFAMHVKGSSICMHDPRVNHPMGLSYATLPMGAYHGKGDPTKGEDPPSPDAAGLARTVVSRQNFAEVLDSLVMCSFAFLAPLGGIPREYVPRLLVAVTGHEWDLDELNRIGERIFNLKRLFVNQLDVTCKADRLPPRFVEIPRVRDGTGHTAAIVADALPHYYAQRGWDDDGKPTQERLRELGIV